MYAQGLRLLCVTLVSAQPISFVVFIVNHAMHILFSGIICCEKSTVQYYILIKTKIIILTEYVVMKEPLDEYYRAVFAFVVNKVPSLLKWFSIYCSCN